MNRLRDDTHEPCGLINLKPNPAYFQNVFRSFLTGRVSHNVRVYRVVLHVGYLVEDARKNATAGRVLRPSGRTSRFRSWRSLW